MLFFFSFFMPLKVANNYAVFYSTYFVVMFMHPVMLPCFGPNDTHYLAICSFFVVMLLAR